VERRNKYLYQLELILLKFLPVLISILYFVGTILTLFNIDVSILSYISGMSILPLLFMYVSSYVFKFCEYHRMFLHYISFNLILNCIDWYIGIPLNNVEYLSIFLLVTCIFMFIILYFYLKSKNEKSN
jgi:hypothetical protein